MKAIKVLLIVILSATIARSQAQRLTIDSLHLMYPPPTVELKYLNDFFTKELIIKKSFSYSEYVPISIRLIMPQLEDGQANNLYLTIENIQVSFAIKEIVSLKMGKFSGHLVVIPISWPSEFKLEQGSRIVFVIKYNYNLKNEIVEQGEVIEEIRFSDDQDQISKSKDEIVGKREVIEKMRSSYYQDQTNKVQGFVIGNKGHEIYSAHFNGQWIMTFGGDAYKMYFNIDKLPHWEITKQIREFTFYRHTFLGQRKKVLFEAPYDGEKKYLIISRDPKRSKRHAFVGTWSDEEPAYPNSSF